MAYDKNRKTANCKGWTDHCMITLHWIGGGWQSASSGIAWAFGGDQESAKV